MAVFPARPPSSIGTQEFSCFRPARRFALPECPHLRTGEGNKVELDRLARCTVGRSGLGLFLGSNSLYPAPVFSFRFVCGLVFSGSQAPAGSSFYTGPSCFDPCCHFTDIQPNPSRYQSADSPQSAVCGLQMGGVVAMSLPPLSLRFCPELSIRFG